MPYLTNENEIKEAINQLTNYSILWVDTETANWKTRHLSRLSLIQVSANSKDTTGKYVYLFDLLDKGHLIDYFVDKIMVNEKIEKVFHNAPYDVQYLGGKDKVKNVTCTLKLARKISLETLEKIKKIIRFV